MPGFFVSVLCRIKSGKAAKLRKNKNKKTIDTLQNQLLNAACYFFVIPAVAGSSPVGHPNEINDLASLILAALWFLSSL